MTWKPVSKFVNPNYTRAVTLLDFESITVQPKLGCMLYDEFSEFRRVREFKKLHCKFQPVRAWAIDLAILTDEFIVHRDDEIFVDSSIHVHATSGLAIQQIFCQFRETLESKTRHISHEYMSETALVLHNEGGGTWGHFLIQNFPKVLLYLEKFKHGKIIVPAPHTDRIMNNFGRLFEVYGISEDRLIGVQRDQSYVFRELILIDFMYNFEEQLPRPTALELLRLRKSGSVSFASSSVEKVFIPRIQGASRKIRNLSSLEPILVSHGLNAVMLGERPIEEQMATWSGASLVVATLGSDLANLIFAKPKSKILVLSPDTHGDRFFFNLAAMLDVQWNEIRCGKTYVSSPIHNSDFDVSVAALDAALQSLI